MNYLSEGADGAADVRRGPQHLSRESALRQMERIVSSNPQYIEKNILSTLCKYILFAKMVLEMLLVSSPHTCVCVALAMHPRDFFISFANTEEFSHPCLVKWLSHQPSVERALITFKVKHLSTLTLSRNGLSGLWNNEVMSFLHTAGKSFGFHTGAAAYTKPALLNAFKATLLACQRVLPGLKLLSTFCLLCSAWEGVPGA